MKSRAKTPTTKRRKGWPAWARWWTSDYTGTVIWAICPVRSGGAWCQRYARWEPDEWTQLTTTGRPVLIRRIAPTPRTNR